jgi:hypothetical protein
MTNFVRQICLNFELGRQEELPKRGGVYLHHEAGGRKAKPELPKLFFHTP